MAERIVKYFDVLAPMNNDINNHGLRYVCRHASSTLFTWFYYLVGSGIEAQAKMNVNYFFFFFDFFSDESIKFEIVLVQSPSYK